MAVNFYDVNFNQPGDNSIPAISGYIIDDYGYDHRTELQGQIPMDYIISKAQATNNIAGATSMDRYLYRAEDTDHNPISFMTCRLQPNGQYVIRANYKENTIDVEIWEETGVVTSTPDATLALTYISQNYSNLSLVGHFDINNELDWVTIGYTYTDEETKETKLFINTNGFSSTIKDDLKPYVYLKYKYEYQVEIQEALVGTNDFQLMRCPTEWFTNYEPYNNPDNNKYSTVCLPSYSDDLTDPENNCCWGWTGLFVFDWHNQFGMENLALQMATYLSNSGGKMGSDIFRINADGTFTTGVDLSQSNRITFNQLNPYDIAFQDGYIRVWEDNYSRKHVAILDAEKNQLDDVTLIYSINSSLYPGDTNPLYDQDICCYLAENNKHFYLIGLRQFFSIYNDGGTQIGYTSSVEGSLRNHQQCGCYQILKVFNTDANTLLSKAVKTSVNPTDPDSLTADETSNQTSDDDDVNEYGEQIPKPKYNEGDWGDGTSEGIRGSGQGRTTGGNSEKTLDEQPGLPGIPTIPTAVSTGFMKLYNPSDAEIQSFCTELTGDSVLLDLKKYLGNNPLDFIVGLQVVPGSYSTSANKYYIEYGSFHSNVSMYAITDEFTEIDYGTLQLEEMYGSWEDYNPHTKMSIYLPFIGIRDLDPDRINGTLLSLKYYVDAVTGSILAVLTSTRKDSGNDGAEYLVGQWAGQASYTIPLTNTQHNSAVNAVIGIVGAGVGIGTAIATGGASALVTAGAIGSVGNALLSGAKSQKTDITMQGGVSGNLAFFTAPDAYIQIEYPLEGRPVDYDHIVGMPSNITTTLKQQPLNNYIEFVNIDVSGLDAPKDEKQMIVDLLTGGVYT